MSANTMKATGIRGLLLTLALSLTAVGATHAANNAQFISQSVPSAMVPGQAYAVSVTMKNTGTTTWTRATNYKLGSINPFNNTTWGMNRVLLPTAADPVAPGQSVTFSFNVTAPATAGTYNFQWQTVLDGVEFFGDVAPNVAVKVGLNDAAFVSQSVPTAMTPGQSYAVSVTMQNTGGTTWTSATNYKLGSINPFNNTTWGLNRVLLPNANPVAPGQSVTFSFNVTAPATPGTYNFQWRTVLDGIEFFGDVAPNVAVKVGLDNAAFVSQSVPATMAPGSVYPVSVTMQNTGSTTWSAGTVSLGSQNPVDNTTWGLNRVALPNAVAPGASVTFNFNVTAPATPGIYNFQWRILEGASSWFGAPTQNASIALGASTPLAGLHFIHVDHLNTPRLVANAAGQAVWKWDQQEPFGSNPADENPSGLGVFDLPLRFPGQTYDKETNLHYNYYRHYDASLGIYEESDPIGLRGGLNTYAYVHGNPLSFVDFFGLKAVCLPGMRCYSTDLDPTQKLPAPLPGDPRNAPSDNKPGPGFCADTQAVLANCQQCCTRIGTQFRDPSFVSPCNVACNDKFACRPGSGFAGLGSGLAPYMTFVF